MRPDIDPDCVAPHLKVRYTAGYGVPARATMPSGKVVLSGLSKEVREELRNPVIALDVKRRAHVIRRISEYDEALGAARPGGRVCFYAHPECGWRIPKVSL